MRLMIGNGISWVLMIRVNINKENGVYQITKQTVSSSILDLIRTIPVCTGLGVRSDVKDVEEFYSDLSGEKVEMKGYIALDALAVVSGWKMQARSMTCMGIQILGTLLNKCVSTGDEKWGVEWTKIPDSLQVYAIGDIRFGHMAYCILAGILLKDVFPDPELICSFLGCFQFEATAWFSEILLDSIRDLEVDSDVAKAAVDRRTLISSLRGRTPSGAVTVGTPRRAWIWSRLLGEWPSTTRGGCRYLHQARLKVLDQVKVIKIQNITWSLSVTLPEIAEKEELYAALGVKLDTPLNWSPAVPNGGMKLARLNTLLPIVLEFDPRTTLGSAISRKCIDLGIYQRFGMYEWARLNPALVDRFLKRMTTDNVFRERYESYYDPIRLIYWRSTDREPLMIPVLEDSLNAKSDALIAHEYAELVKARELVAAREKRWKELCEARDWNNMVIRGGWRQALSNLPSWKPKTRRGKKRPRSSCVVQSIRTQPMRETVVSEPAPGPSKEDPHAGEMVESEAKDSGDEVLLCDEDEGAAAPQRSKRRKKQGGSARILRTYDEMIEAENVLFSDEYELELFDNSDKL